MSEMSWHAANHRWLNASLARLRSLLGDDPGSAPETSPEPRSEAFGGALGEDNPPALLRLASRFSLSPFERDLLLLAAGPEIDPGFGALCAKSSGERERPFPTFGLAMAMLPGPHWSALAPSAALRRWRLLEVLPGPGLTACPLQVEERVLHYLLGLDVPDARLAGITSPLPTGELLVPSHQRQADRLLALWSRVEREAPVVLLCGVDTAGKRAVAATACAALGLGVSVLPAALLPTAASELDGLLRLLGREAALGQWAVLLDCDSSSAGDVASSEAARMDAVARFAEALPGPLLVAVPERRRLGRRPLQPLDVDRPDAGEQRTLWQTALGRTASEQAALDDTADGLDGLAAQLAAQFDLSSEAIYAAAIEGLERAMASEALPAALWSACRAQARPDIESLAKRLRPAASWHDLVVPESERRVLQEIAVHVRRRAQVHDEWGFAARSSRGLGISALFAGPSGTGKTMAAEVLARELDLDLYRVDLAATVSKYIGETEKNLKRIFDAAEAGGAVLLFDEADALFGKRSEVKDSHDRYANIEVGYLLQRVETYRGLAILTTNRKDALDSAFLRRLRFVVRFPFPEAALRAEIWRRVFPSQTPTAGLDFERLARLGLAGGHIKSIAIAAAFRAAEEGRPVGMRQVLAAARSEYAKLEKPFIEKGMEVGQ